MPENSDNLNGLSGKQAEKLLLRDGPNSLPEPKPLSFPYLFLRQFKSPFIYVLLIAAIISFGLGKNINGIFIFAVLLLNAIIGSFQEFSAEKAAIALNALVPQMTTVLRDGHTQQIDSKKLVCNDLVYLTSGDRVPADGICLQTNQLTLNESLLTGESLSVVKESVTDVPGGVAQSGILTADTQNEYDNIDHCNNADRYTCYAGTSVVQGRALLKIVATGLNTEIGKISSVISQKDPVKAPLLQRIEHFTLQVTFATLFVIALIFIISIIRGEALTHIFFLGVALAVSAIPEGLPAAITVALAIGMRRMAKKNVIIRSLLAVESLGSCTYIASDKTGTLTINDMTVQKLLLPNGSAFRVTGEGLDIEGDIKPDKTAANKKPSKGASGHYAIVNEDDANGVEKLCTIGALCNESELYLHNNRWTASGDQVDIALLVLFNKLKKSHTQLQLSYPEISRIPYEPENAYSASLNQVAQQVKLLAKGSAEKLIQMCKLSPVQKQKIHAQVNALASEGYRVLAFAEKTLDSPPEKLDSELHSLVFAGLVGIIDPLRKEAAMSVEQCRNAKIKVAMITGDHPETARTIANKLGIIKTSDKVITGDTISALYRQDEEKLAEIISNSNTFARVRPVEKKIIVEQLQKQGHFVAVTGDGVNDAPALKTAHVGIAMGKRGTDVARESSDIILTDDNFSSIVNGIIEGRIVYANIRKVVFLLISTGAAEILLFIFSLLAGLPLPLFPIQLLWLNLVTNGIQDVALAFEPAEGNEINKPPRSPKESIFNRVMIERVIINAITMSIIAFLLFAFHLEQGMGEQEARNLTLLLMVLFENAHALNSRSEKLSLLKLPFFSNKLLLFGILIAQSVHIGAMYNETLSHLLELNPVTLSQWFNLLSIALLLIVVEEARKWWSNARQKTMKI